MNKRVPILLVATGNRGKLTELRVPLATLAQSLRTLSDYGLASPEEVGTTFAENALLKARYGAEHTGLPTLGDDSGIVVPALGGAPGIYSARYAGVHATSAENNDKLLRAMRDCTDRRAYFECHLVLCLPSGQVVTASARWHGEILTAPCGQHGFGYDPLFFVPEQGCTAAELTPEHKNKISHRGQALARLLAQVASGTF